MLDITIFEAIKGMQQPPCEKYACKDFNLCASQKLACYSFQMYVNSGRSVHPTTVPRGGSRRDSGPNSAIYNKIHKDDDLCESE